MHGEQLSEMIGTGKDGLMKVERIVQVGFRGRGGLRTLIAAVITVTIGLASCGGESTRNDDGGGGAELGGLTGVESDKTLDELGDDEIETLCENASEVIKAELDDGFATQFCYLAAAAISDSVEECEEQFVCFESETDVESTADVESCVTDLEGTEPCDVTVAELESCLSDYVEFLTTISSIQSCADAFELDEVFVAEDFQAPTCVAVEERCPDRFTSGQDPGPVDPNAAGISGEIGGESVSIGSNNSGYSGGSSGSGDEWSTEASFGGAELLLWGDAESSQGLLRMPESGPHGSEWICLGELEIEGAQEYEGQAWSSSSLSVLDACEWAGGAPLSLEFNIGGTVEGEFQGEPVSWTSFGYSCSGACTFSFEDDGNDVSLLLELDQPGFSDGEPATVVSSALIQMADGVTVACGGGGSVLSSSDGRLRVDIDEFGPPQSCPGTAVEGELSGVL